MRVEDEPHGDGETTGEATARQETTAEDTAKEDKTEGTELGIAEEPADETARSTTGTEADATSNDESKPKI